MNRSIENSAAPLDSDRSALIFARWVGGVVVSVLFMGSTLLTPIYELYRDIYGIGPLQLTQIYAVYVVGNLIALLFLGGLSDQLGRRSIIYAGLALAAISALLLLVATNTAWLYAARIVSGCAVGVGSGAATAWISETYAQERRAMAASIMTAFNFVGLALGPCIGGFLVQYAPQPTRLPFAVYLALLIIVALCVMRTRETVQARTHTSIQLKPRLGVPRNLRMAFIAPAAAGFIAMSLVGYYAALGPIMIRQTLNINNHALSAMMITELFIISTLTILIARNFSPRPALIAGLLLTPPALVALLAAQNYSSSSFMLLGMTISGIASALGYRGGLSVINAMAPADRRAEMASAYFVCCFLGNALPVIGVGALSERMGSAVAARALAILLSILAITAIAAAWFGKRREKQHS